MPRARRTVNFRWGGATVAIAVAIASGCSKPPSGPARFPVTGQITFDGKPVPRGTIAFEPDTQAGNSGPGGYGTITDGRFTTHPRMGAVSGAQFVRIAGFDGQATAELIDGKPLFPEHTTTVELPAKAATIDFEVPLTAKKPKKTAGPTTPPKR
jgi:hypothetical protein